MSVSKLNTAVRNIAVNNLTANTETTGVVNVVSGFAGGSGNINMFDGNQTVVIATDPATKEFSITETNGTGGTPFSYKVLEVDGIGAQPFSAGYNMYHNLGQGDHDTFADGGVGSIPVTVAAGVSPGAPPYGHGSISVGNKPSSNDGNALYTIWCGGSNGGGLGRSQGSVYGYYNAAGFTNTIQAFVNYVPNPTTSTAIGANTGVTRLNLGQPLDGARMGTLTMTGSAQIVPVGSLQPGATVQLSLVGTTNAGGLAAYTGAIPRPTVAVNAATTPPQFTITGTAGLIYDYMVVG